ncbi:cytidyltransferase [Vibrio phage D479]
MSKAVYIGRFRPFHLGHMSVILDSYKDLDLSELVILVGSSNKHCSAKNPFTFQQVKRMIELSFAHTKMNINVRSLDDYQSDAKWQTAVRYKAGKDVTHIIGYDKDESSYYLKMFPEWKLHQPTPHMSPTPVQKVLSATDIRDDLLSTQHTEMTLDQFSAFLPMGTLKFLRQWISSTEYDLMRSEYQSAQAEISKFDSYPYPQCLNICCSDSVVTCNGMVLLVERKFSPGKGLLALPGGHKDSDETFLDCAVRELREETRLKIPEKVIRGSLKSEKMFDDPKRSYPHTRVTMAYNFDVAADPDGKMPKVKAADDAASAKWYTLEFVSRNPELLYDDHRTIIEHFTGV